jgi:hypothetical protein
MLMAACGQTSAQMPQPVHSWRMSFQSQSMSYSPFAGLRFPNADTNPQMKTASRIGKQT